MVLSFNSLDKLCICAYVTPPSLSVSVICPMLSELRPQTVIASAFEAATTRRPADAIRLSVAVMSGASEVAGEVQAGEMSRRVSRR